MRLIVPEEMKGTSATLEKGRLLTCPLSGHSACRKDCAWMDKQLGVCGLIMSLYNIVECLQDIEKTLQDIEKNLRRVV